jgi:hypothetical protein
MLASDAYSVMVLAAQRDALRGVATTEHAKGSGT